ncbi:MAG TPA: hypothetical protein VIH48_04005 [Candidatus Bathyarchaeia archaeon]
MDYTIVSLLITVVIIGFGFLVLALIIRSLQRGPKKYAGQRYAGEGFDEKMEIDLRLTYKRFKEIYPYSKLTYEEYKKLQKERAFKRALSSQQNKRMVR